MSRVKIYLGVKVEPTTGDYQVEQAFDVEVDGDGYGSLEHPTLGLVEVWVDNGPLIDLPTGGLLQ